jgi:methyl-accepting chemotaxis protein
VVDVTSIVDTVILAGVGYLGIRQQSTIRQTKHTADENSEKLEGIHKLVNQQLTDSETRRDNAETRTGELEQQARDVSGIAGQVTTAQSSLDKIEDQTK